MAWLNLSLCVLLAGQVLARYGSTQSHQNLKRQSVSPDLTIVYPEYNFTMPVDHFHNESRYAPHTNATFENRYWLDTSYYVEGGPVIVNALGEDNVYPDFPWLQKGLVQELANATGGVALLWGQRYYPGGYDIVSQPYTASNLRFHSTEQALADLAYFATRVKFPGLESKNLTAPGTPWIVTGGSYAGVISAFSRIQYPDIFWGGISSSGVTTAIDDFWQFYDVVRRYAPSTCIEAQQKLTLIVDNILTGGNQTQIAQLKEAFGVNTSTSTWQFTNILVSPMGYWQGNQWVPGENYDFTEPGSFCANITSEDLLFPSSTNLSHTAIEIISNGGFANETTSLLHPVLNWFASINYTYVSYCDGQTIDECYSVNSPFPYDWLTCTEYGLFATGYVPGAPGRPSALPVASRFLKVSDSLENCKTTYNLTSGPVLSRFNKYGGFNLSYPRLALSAGQIDIWRPAQPLAEEVSSGVPNARAGSNGTTGEPQIVMALGGHEWDLSGVFANETNSTVPPPTVKSAHARELHAVQGWLEEWHQEFDTEKPSEL